MSAKGLRNVIFSLNNIGTNVKDKDDYFQIDFDQNDFETHGKMSPKITQIKKFLENMGASCVISKNQIKAYKNVKKEKTNEVNKKSNSWSNKIKNLNIPINEIGENSNPSKINWGYYDDGKVGFAYAGYKDPKTGKLSVDLDDIWGIKEKESIDELHQALNEKFKKDNSLK